MGIVESHDGEERAWFVERLYEVALECGGAEVGAGNSISVGTEAETRMARRVVREVMEGVVEKILKRFLWIDELHGVKFWENLDPYLDGKGF
jgi:hypothetical protein